MAVEIILSSKGKPMLCLNNFLFHYDHPGADKHLWRCSNFQRSKCRARIHTSKNLKDPEIIGEFGEHSHPPESIVQVKRVLGKIREEATNSTQPPAEIIKSTLTQLLPQGNDGGMDHPKINIQNLKRGIRRVRERARDPKKKRPSTSVNPFEEEEEEDEEDFEEMDISDGDNDNDDGYILDNLGDAASDPEFPESVELKPDLGCSSSRNSGPRPFRGGRKKDPIWRFFTRLGNKWACHFVEGCPYSILSPQPDRMKKHLKRAHGFLGLGSESEASSSTTNISASAGIPKTTPTTAREIDESGSDSDGSLGDCEIDPLLDADGDGERKKVGRQRDPVWKYFHRNEEISAFQCNDCNYKLNRPQADRMRRHRLNCHDAANTIPADADNSHQPQPNPSSTSAPNPKSGLKTNSITRELKRIANALEEANKLKKYKLGLNPFLLLDEQIQQQPNQNGIIGQTPS